jgi:hypothetical protein
MPLIIFFNIRSSKKKVLYRKREERREKSQEAVLYICVRSVQILSEEEVRKKKKNRKNKADVNINKHFLFLHSLVSSFSLFLSINHP